MEIEDIETDYTPPPPARRSKPRVFDWTINLGHVFIVCSFLLSAAGLYSHMDSRMAVIETKVDAISSQNLPPRVSALEAQTHDLHEGLAGIHDVLLQILNKLDTKADKK